jgi:hypothetical protein
MNHPKECLAAEPQPRWISFGRRIFGFRYANTPRRTDMPRLSSAILSFVLVLIVLAGSACSFRLPDFSFLAPADYPPIVTAEKNESPPTPEQKEWALALGAMLAKTNHERLDLLGGGERSPEAQQFDQELLSRGWGIKNRKDLLDTLTWIQRGGHRKAFNDMAAMLAGPGEQRKVENYADPVMRNRVTLVLQFNSLAAGNSIAAWDFGRYVNLCSWGYQAGYLSEDEAWQKIMPVARTMQRNFHSWETFGGKYLTGRNFWSGSARDDTAQRVFLAYTQLVHDADSPWQQIPWDLDLTAVPRAESKPGSR